ncbi:MAG: helix-turn-helix transcriptional regulator, partial [Rhodospirillales bacterium]
MMNTREVAAYLRIKERKVYDLVRTKSIPATRVTGKWLFPRDRIDQWLARGCEIPAIAAPPPVCAGSHDPWLEWCLRESGCGLAMLSGGSLDGLKRMAAGQAVMAGLHVLDKVEEAGGAARAGGEEAYNVAAVKGACPDIDGVLIQWAWRVQGLVLAPSNPKSIRSISDLLAANARLAVRQPEAGSRILLDHLLGQEGVDMGDLDILDAEALNETDLCLAVLEGKADAGL